MGRSAAAVFVATLSLAWPQSAGAQGPSARVPALSPFQRQKARALLRDKLSCLGCHRIGGEGGIIGPDLSRGGGARTPEFVLRMMITPRDVALAGTMPAVQLPGETALLVARYVAALDEVPVPVTAAPPAKTARPGETGERYARLCASCHGSAGDGDGPNARYLPVPAARHASAAEMSKRNDDRLYDAIAAGGAVLGRSPRMPAFGGSISDAEIRALVKHIRVLCKCEGPAWSVR